MLCFPLKVSNIYIYIYTCIQFKVNKVKTIVVAIEEILFNCDSIAIVGSTIAILLS